MGKESPSKKDLLAANAELRARLEEAEETLRAIRQGEVDAIVATGPEGEQVYTLKGADHSYRVLVETINEGTATVLASGGTVVYANRLLADMLKKPLEKFIGSCFCDFVPRAERHWFEALLAKARQEASRGEIRLQAADGTLVPAYLSLSSMSLETVPDAICMAVTDLTEQKRQEEILSKQRLFKAILDQAEHTILVCDPKGIITQASRAAHHLFSGNPLLRRFEEVFTLRVKVQERADTTPFERAFFLAPVLQGKVVRGLEADYRCQDGRDFHLLVDAGPITGDNGAVLGCVVVLTDITARKRQEMELQKLLEEQRSLTEELTATNEELSTQAEELTLQKAEQEKLNFELERQKKLLESANEELEAFTYSVSHDLKAPVRTIAGFSRMLLQEHSEKLDDEAHRLLQVVIDNTRLMHHLIDDLLALSRLGRMQIKKSIIDLGNMTRQIFDLLLSEAPKRDVQLKMGDLPPALGDQSLLYQVMTNLLGNAFKFTKARETAVIEVGGRSEGTENIYYVRDNGIGFDNRYITNLFRPFQRLHPHGEYDGSGVGLAIVKRIILRHGGRVWAEGKLGKGATFYVALPNTEW